MDIAEEIRNILSRYQANTSPTNALPTVFQRHQVIGLPAASISSPVTGNVVSTRFQSNTAGAVRSVETPIVTTSGVAVTPTFHPPQDQVSEQLRSNFEPYSFADRRGSLPQTNTSVSSMVNHMRESQLSRNPIPGPSRTRLTRPLSRPATKWTASLVFLGAPDESTHPTAERNRTLSNGGLGKTHVTCDLVASATDLQAAIMDVFQRESAAFFMQQFRTPGFGFSLASLRGSGMRDLTFFKSPVSPRECKSLGVKILYARPSVLLIEMDAEEDGINEQTVDQDNSTVVINDSPPSSTTRSVFESFSLPQRTAESVTAQGSGGFQLDMTDYADLDSLRRLLGILHPGYQTLEVPQLGCQLLPLNLLNTIGNLNVDQSIRVAIESEQTVDAGGPRRSFLWKLMCSIRDGLYNGVSIVEGSGNALTISNDRCLQSENVMYNLGRFFALAIVNIGFGFFGLNKLLVRMICDTWLPTADDIGLEDIPNDYAKTTAAILLEGVNGGITAWTVEERRQVRSFLYEKNWGFEVTAANVKQALDFVKIESVYESRQQSIMEVRRGFLNTDTGRWVKCHPEQHHVIFPKDLPRDKEFEELESSILGLEEHQNLLEMFRRYFEVFPSSEKKISKFIEAVTGLPYLGQHRINVLVSREPQLFTCNTCSCEFNMFDTPNQDIFAYNMDLFLANCNVGFTRL